MILWYDKSALTKETTCKPMLKNQSINQHCLLITKEEKLSQILFPSCESYLTGRKQWTIYMRQESFSFYMNHFLMFEVFWRITMTEFWNLGQKIQSPHPPPEKSIVPPPFGVYPPEINVLLSPPHPPIWNFSKFPFPMHAMDTLIA